MKSFIVFLLVVFCLSYAVAAQQKVDQYEESLKTPGPHSFLIKFLRIDKTKEVGKTALGVFDLIGLGLLDLGLSFLCLWLAMFILTETKAVVIKEYLWFLFSFNLTWLATSFLYTLVWLFLNFLIGLQPELRMSIIDNSALVMVIVAILLFNWLLARTFHLTFFGALGTQILANVFYFIVLFAFFLFSNPVTGGFIKVVNENLGVKAAAQAYYKDVVKVSSGSDLLGIIRLRAFHL